MTETDRPAVPPRGIHGLARRVESLVPAKWRRNAAVVPVVRLGGTIGAVTPLRPGLSLSGVAKLLDRAFETRGAKAVAISINSPGGSPVQSHFIYSRIRQLAADKKLPVLAFTEDVAASGGYMIACAADEIFCDRFSILGSIGVVGGSFGFEELIKKIGIERRLYTSGEHKAMLDPFLPQNPDDVARLKAIQRQIHDDFIALVKSSRGPRLKGPEDELFTGAYWAGERAVELGLADGIGDLRGTLRARFGDKVSMPLIAAPTGLLSSFTGRKGGTASLNDVLDLGSLAQRLPNEAISAIEERAVWARVRILRHDLEKRVPVFGLGHASKNFRSEAMPPLVMVALAAAGGTALARWLLREARRVNDRLDAQRAVDDGKETAPRLRRDPETGTYRPG